MAADLCDPFSSGEKEILPTTKRLRRLLRQHQLRTRTEAQTRTAKRVSGMEF